MTATQEITFPSAASVASELTDLLGLGLPEPGLISIHSGGNGEWARDISLQFSGPDDLDAVRVWADYFGSPVKVHSSRDQLRTWHEAEFTSNGVKVNAYAVIKTNE